MHAPVTRNTALIRYKESPLTDTSRLVALFPFKRTHTQHHSILSRLKICDATQDGHPNRHCPQPHVAGTYTLGDPLRLCGHTAADELRRRADCHNHTNGAVPSWTATSPRGRPSTLFIRQPATPCNLHHALFLARLRNPTHCRFVNYCLRSATNLDTGGDGDRRRERNSCRHS